jgi:ATP-dependent DNA ligase
LKDAQKFFENEAEGTVNKYELRPMLGKDIEQTKKIDGKNETVFEIHRLNFPVIVQRKLNGIHVMVFYDEEINEVILMSRTGLRFTVFEGLAESLLPWFRKNQTIVIDGELYSHDTWSFQALSGISRKKKLKDLTDEQIEILPKIIVNVFDFIDLKNMEYGYSDRMNNAHESLGPYLAKLKNKDAYVPCEIIETFPANNRKEIDEIYRKFLDDGFEGAMIRNDNMPFVFGKRVSDRLFKYKPEYDAEFKLIGFNEGSGKLAKTPIWIFETKEGLQFSCTPTGTIADRKELFAEVSTEKGRKKWLNKYYTIKFYGYSNDKIPTHANVDTPPINKHKGGL